MCTDTIANANMRLVDAHAELPLTKALGGRHLASARRPAVRRAGPLGIAAANPKYFDRPKGLTYINYTSAGSLGFFGFVVPGTLRDSVVILDRVLEQDTSGRPTTLVTNSASYSDIVFGLFMLLGYRFCPRSRT
jgi:TnpA family transposase